MSSLSYFNEHKIRSLITTVNPKKIVGFAVAAVDRRRRRRRRPSPPSTVAAAVAVDRRRRRPSPPPSPSTVAAAVAVDSPSPRIGESGSRLFEQILGPLKQRHHQWQKIFNNIFFQCIVLDYVHGFARYWLKWTFRKY